MLNPRIDPGVLNRVRGTLKVTNFPELNVSASYVTRPNMRITRTTTPTSTLPVLTGVVQSPQPYMMTTVAIHLNRAAGLADVYIQQIQSSSLIGDVEIWTDTPALSNIVLRNSSLSRVGDVDLSGEDAEEIFEITGIEDTNDNLWNFS